MISRYFASQDPDDLKLGGVASLGNAGAQRHFMQCPCGERTVVLGPGHGVSVAEDGAVSTKHSIGYRHKDDKPENWCHWHIQAGKPSFYADAKCPGKNLY